KAPAGRDAQGQHDCIAEHFVANRLDLLAQGRFELPACRLEPREPPRGDPRLERGEPPETLRHRRCEELACPNAEILEGQGRRSVRRYEPEQTVRRSGPQGDLAECDDQSKREAERAGDERHRRFSLGKGSVAKVQWARVSWLMVRGSEPEKAPYKSVEG